MNPLIYKLPQEFILKLKKLYPQQYIKIGETFLKKNNPCFRVNYLKIDLISLRKSLVNQKVKFQELAFPRGAFLLKYPLRSLQKTEVYKKGHIYVQNLSSMIPALILEPQDQDKVLDLCAAPGAKTTQIASLAPGAEITAIEKIRTRYYKLLANLKNQGAENVKTLVIDAIWVRKKFPEYFDKILADVPCSAEGRFLVTDPKTFKYWKQRKVKEMMHKQKKLLHSAFLALSIGGTLVYSTCTLSPEENEAVIDWLLNKFKGSVELAPIKLPFKNAQAGFTRWKEAKFSDSLQRTKRIIPDGTMEGFFIAKLKKTSY